MICTASTAILNVQDSVVVEVHHFMEQRSNDIFKWSVECSACYIDLAFALFVDVPCVKGRIMRVGALCGAYSNNRGCKLIVEYISVEVAEQEFQ